MTLWALALTIASVPAVVLPSPPAAAAAQLDPVTALRRRLTSDDGVTFSNVMVSRSGGKPMTFRESGVHELAQGKIVASEIVRPKDFMFGKYRQRLILFPNRVYEQSAGLRKYLPQGKSWVVSEEKQSLALVCGQMRLSVPGTLKALLAATEVKRPSGVYDGTRTTLYEGSITLGELAKADPDLRIGVNHRPTGKYARVRIDWQLWIGQDQLIRRCHSDSRQPGIPKLSDKPIHYVNDIRLSRWGRPIDIQAPPTDQVATYDELNIPE
ncbi:hypothetical protein ACIBQ1_44380 [Nonomuraea sp. NPDC050153]|uniref:hypothetical protein n=1 Tax=Nonomuraea sp. NPDC050153 TaxID=3364359 RepID=UPI0037A5E44A